MCRGSTEIDASVKQKVSMFCMVDINQVSNQFHCKSCSRGGGAKYSDSEC